MDTSFLWTLVYSVGKHWPFFTAALFFCSAGVVSKRLVPKATRGWRWLFRATLPLHPVLMGIAFGALPGAPVSQGVDGTTARVMYYAFAGLCSTWAYDAVRQWSEARGLHLPSGDSIPPQ